MSRAISDASNSLYTQRLWCRSASLLLVFILSSNCGQVFLGKINIMFNHLRVGAVLNTATTSRGVLILVLMALAACSQIPAPDDNISKDAVDIYSKTLAAMDDAAVKAYSGSKRPQFYQQVQDQIRVMQLRAQGSGSTSDQAIIPIGDQLSMAFAIMKKDDEAGWYANNLKGRQFKIHDDLDAIQSIIVTILRHQAGLKGLSAASGSSG